MVVIEENELIITENSLDLMTPEEVSIIKDVCRAVVKRRKEKMNSLSIYVPTIPNLNVVS